MKSFKKKSIIRVTNKDSLSFQRCLVLGISFILNITRDFPNYASIQYINSATQTKYAKILSTKLNIDQNKTVGFREIKKIKKELLIYKIQLIIFTNFNYNSHHLFFKGKNLPHKIYIFYHSKHFDFIKNPCGFFGLKYFCRLCTTPFNNKMSHTCAYRCKYCKTEGDTHVDSDNIQQCDLCLYKFHGSKCFKNHINNDICRQRKKCPKCYINHHYNKSCGLPCSTCHVFLTKDMTQKHVCFLQPRKINNKQDKTSFLFYDIETFNVPLPCTCHTGRDRTLKI